MKKLLTLIVAATLLVSCGTNKSSEPVSSVEASSNAAEASNTSSSEGVKEYDRSKLSIISPTGAPALAFYQYGSNSKFETNSDPATGIIPLMVGGKKDVVVLPTNAGMQAIIGKKAEYKIAATISFGNFYLVSMGNDANNEIGADDNIVLFQKGNVPDKIFHYVYGDTLNAGIHYLPAVSDAATAAISGSYVDPDTGTNMTPNYVLLAQPVLTNVKNKNANVTVYADIQAEYKKKSNNLKLFQASVFVKNSVAKETADAFLASLKSDVDAAIKTPEIISEKIGSMENAAEVYGVNPTLAVNVTKNNNGMGLGFEYAKDNKDAIANFLKLFNIEGYSEEVYYQ